MHPCAKKSLYVVHRAAPTSAAENEDDLITRVLLRSLVKVGVLAHEGLCITTA